MAQKSLNYLKNKYKTGDLPSQQDFADLLDTTYNYLGIIDPANATTGLTNQVKVKPNYLPGALHTALFSVNAGQDANAFDGTYFILANNSGETTAYWYDIDDSGTSEPTNPADRAVEISSVLNTDNNNEIASKTAVAITLDTANTNCKANQAPGGRIYAYCLEPGRITGNHSGTTPWDDDPAPDMDKVIGVEDPYFNRYFIINDLDGTVALWFTLNYTAYFEYSTVVDETIGVEPLHGADRSINCTISSIWHQEGQVQTMADVVDYIGDAFQGDSKFDRLDVISGDDSPYVFVNLVDVGSVGGETSDGTSSGITLTTTRIGDNIYHPATPECFDGSYGHASDYSKVYQKLNADTWKYYELNDLPSIE